MFQIKSVLITDDIDDVCIRILQENGLKVAVETKLDKEQLLCEVSKHDALIVRSSTKVTAEVIKAGKQLKVIGRAGTGVDNIDVSAATEHGIIVMKHVGQANESMKTGKWERKNFMGSELFGKTLAIIGLGHIGREVACRMQAFGMKTVGTDPLVSATQAAEFGVEWLDLHALWAVADYITVHVPLIPQTENMMNAQAFAQCKRGVRVINCARGGIISETALRDALVSGQCGGAGLDVFTEEPPKSDLLKVLIAHPHVLCTPHLGASTIEAQERVAEEIAQQFVWLNRSEKLAGAVNASHMALLLDPGNAAWCKTAQSLGRLIDAVLHVRLQDDEPYQLDLAIPPQMKRLEKALWTATLVGCLKRRSTNGLNMISAASLAKGSGVQIRMSEGDANTLSLKSTQITLSACVSPIGSLLSHIDHHALGLPILLKDSIMLVPGTPSTVEVWYQCGFCGTENWTVVALEKSKVYDKLPAGAIVCEF